MALRKAPRTHERKISDVTAEFKSSAKGIRKRQVSIKASEGADATGELLGATMVPNSEQLAKINNFTRIQATEENVVAFKVMACNDIYDRDDEKFTTQCVDGFAELPGTFSPIGKSYMLDHEYKVGNARGRIFDVGSHTVQGVRFLMPEVYVPKTAQYADFIEAIDFGINWAVSVGVVIDAANCSICKGTVYSSRFFGSWCENGHEKGYFYVPGEEKDDGWGYYEPVDPKTPKAVKAMVDLSEPRDFYELSQVFLGAQYMAQLADKSPGFKGVIRAASAATIPILGLDAKLANQIRFATELPQVVEAKERYAPETLKDGTMRWTDDQGLVWQFDPEDGQIGCLGKSEELPPSVAPDPKSPEALTSRYEALCSVRAGEIAEKLSKAADDSSDGSGDDDKDPVQLAEQLDSLIDEAGDAIDSEDYDQASNLLDTADDVSDDLLEALGGTDADEDDDDEGKGVQADAGLVKLLHDLKAPASIVSVVSKTSADDGLRALISESTKEIETLTAEVVALKPKAALGEQYIAKAKADAIAWFTKSRMNMRHPAPVNVELAQRMIERCKDDLDLILSLSADWEAEAKRRFPQVRRSVFPDASDPNAPQPPPVLPAEMTEGLEVDPRVQHLHPK